MLGRNRLLESLLLGRRLRRLLGVSGLALRARGYQPVIADSIDMIQGRVISFEGGCGDEDERTGGM